MGSKALYLSPANGGVRVFACEGDVYAPNEGSVCIGRGPWTGLATYSLRTSHRLMVVGEGRAGAYG